MARDLGTKMQQKVTRVVGGKPSATFYQQQAKFQEEVREYLETPLDLTTGTDLSLSGDLSAATVTTAEADIRHGDRVLEIPASPAQGESHVEFAGLTSGSGAAAASHLTASISPTVGLVVYVCVVLDSSAGTPVSITSVTGNGITYASVVTIGDGDTVPVTAIFRGLPLSSGQITISLSASREAKWSVIQTENQITSGTHAANGVAQSGSAAGTTVTISNQDSGNALLVWAGRNTTTAPTVETGYTTIHSLSASSSSAVSAYIWQPEGYRSSTPNFTNAVNIAACEIRCARRWLNSTSVGGQASRGFALAVGDRIKRVDVQGRHVGASGTFSASLWKVTKSTGVVTQVGTTQTSSSGSTADEEISISGLNETVAADSAYFIEWTATAVADQRLYGASVTYDRP